METGTNTFKNAGTPPVVGVSSCQLVLSRLIVHAQELLASDKLEIVKGSYASGFASQAQMNDVLRQQIGVTTGRYRDEVRE